MTTLNEQAAQCLENAAMVLQLPGWWTRGEYARNAAGNSRPMNSPEACSFCAIGGMTAATGGGTVKDIALGALSHHIGERTALYNDRSKSPKRVVRAMLETAEELRSQS